MPDMSYDFRKHWKKWILDPFFFPDFNFRPYFFSAHRSLKNIWNFHLRCVLCSLNAHLNIVFVNVKGINSSDAGDGIFQLGV